MVTLLQGFPKWLQLLLVFSPAFATIIASIALLLNWKQSRLNGNLTRVQIVSDFVKVFMENEKMQSAFYKIEYENFIYSSEFHDSEGEKEIDALLRHFSNIALMWSNGVLRLKDIKQIEYLIVRVVGNPEILKYIDFLERWTSDSKSGQHPFVGLKKLNNALSK